MKENIIKLLEDQTFTYRKIDELAQYFEMNRYLFNLLNL